MDFLGWHRSGNRRTEGSRKPGPDISDGDNSAKCGPMAQERRRRTLAERVAAVLALGKRSAPDAPVGHGGRAEKYDPRFSWGYLAITFYTAFCTGYAVAVISLALRGRANTPEVVALACLAIGGCHWLLQAYRQASMWRRQARRSMDVNAKLDERYQRMHESYHAEQRQNNANIIHWLMKHGHEWRN
jgi:hypothetical protein